MNLIYVRFITDIPLVTYGIGAKCLSTYCVCFLLTGSQYIIFCKMYRKQDYYYINY